MSRVLICTVGTSLLTNRDNRPWAGWQRNLPLPEVPVVDEWFAQADPAVASAETNTLRALDLDVSDRVVLLHSDTPEGTFCSQRLAGYLRAGRCQEVEERRLGALGYQHSSFAQRGLRSLVDHTLQAIGQAQRRGLQPVLCATGGFKAEIAFLNLLGALLQVEVCYIHEQFREVVRLPRLPLAWDHHFVLGCQDFFNWIDAEPRRSQEVEGWLRGRPDLRPLVEDDEDGHTYLNAAGNLLFQVAKQELAVGPRATWPEASPRAPADKLNLSKVEHHRPRGWERFVNRLAEIDCVSGIGYDPTASTGAAVRPLNPTEGTIAVRYSAGGEILPLVVQTTARGEAQTELVAEYLRHRLR